MKVIVYDPHWRNMYRFDLVAALSSLGHDAYFTNLPKAGEIVEGTIVLSPHIIPNSERSRIEQIGAKVYGASSWNRQRTMEFAAEHDITAVDWVAVTTREDALAQFDSWEVDQMIWKGRARSAGAGSVQLVTRDSLNAGHFASGAIFQRDIGTHRLVKLEGIGATYLIGSISNSQTSAEGMNVGREGWRNRHGYRTPAELKEFVVRCGQSMFREGIGHFSIDLLQTSNALYFSEVNVANIGTKWGPTRPSYLDRFLAGWLALLEQPVEA